MTGGPANIDSWFEFLVWFVIAGAALLGAVQSWRGRREHARQSETIEEVRDQVSNTHTTNLRDELDERHRELMTQLSKLDERTRRIGDDHRREVDARRDGDRRIADNLARIDERLDRQDRIADKHHPGEA